MASVLALVLGCNPSGLPAFADPVDPDAGGQTDDDAGEESSDAGAR